MLRIAICDDDKILVTQIEEMGWELVSLKKLR